MGTVAIIGDVGGQLTSLKTELTRLGCDPETGHIPAGLTIVQVGDLVHRGPNSPGVVKLVDRFYSQNPDQWVQLCGNHDALYVKDRIFSWNETLPDDTVATIQKWWNSGWMRLGYATETRGQEVRVTGGLKVMAGAGDLLVTHAGFTAGRWLAHERPQTASEAADAINYDGRARAWDDWAGVWSPGLMLFGSVNPYAGVVWAEASAELATSWANLALSEKLPGFHQAHGHSRAVVLSKDGVHWTTGIRNLGRERVMRKFNPETKLSRLLILPTEASSPSELVTNSMAIWGTDPGHGKYAAQDWAALELARLP